MLIFFFCKIKDCSVEKAAILVANSEGETTAIYNFRTHVATESSQPDVSLVWLGHKQNSAKQPEVHFLVKTHICW